MDPTLLIKPQLSSLLCTTRLFFLNLFLKCINSFSYNIFRECFAPDPFYLITHQIWYPLSLSLKKHKNENKNEPIFKKPKQNKKSPTVTTKTMYLVLCSSTTAGHGAHPRVWLIHPVTPHRRKVIFFSCQWISITNSFVVRGFSNLQRQRHEISGIATWLSTNFPPLTKMILFCLAKIICEIK